MNDNGNDDGIEQYRRTMHSDAHLQLAASFKDVIAGVDELDDLYRRPTAAVLDKETQSLDDGCRRFIERSTFVLIGTCDAAGRLDVSPRGGPAGFVKVLDDRRLVVPDLNGNNRLDSIRNIVVHPRIAMLFVIPGLGETLRLNGAACITTDDEILDLFTDELRRPTTAIGVVIEHAFIHCAKALRRGALWQPDSWPAADERPSPGQILAEHAGVADTITGEQVDAALEESYAHDLAADLPEASTG